MRPFAPERASTVTADVKASGTKMEQRFAKTRARISGRHTTFVRARVPRRHHGGRDDGRRMRANRLLPVPNQGPEAARRPQLDVQGDDELPPKRQT